MKAFVGKTFGTIATSISAISRVYVRSSSSSDHTDSSLGHELDSVAASNMRGGSLEPETFRDTSPSLPPSPVERCLTPEEDEVLYRKNNVLLKYPARKTPSEHIPLDNATQSDSQVLIPGFLFITTRGSNFGSTLLLNWAPNSSMRAPGTDGIPATAGEEGGQSHYDLDRPSCSSVSIDLGMMEIIRIFYHTDENGFITKGEMVISSKDRNFKVFHFRNGGLSELINIFRSWKYFNHQMHRASHQHTFTIYCPKLSLAELHPLEGTVKSVLTEEMWRDLLDAEGRVIDGRYVLKVRTGRGMGECQHEIFPYSSCVLGGSSV